MTGSGSSSGHPETSISTAERRYTLLDVFTDVALAGNALAVVHDADGLDDRTMLAFARETRLSETTFVQSATVDGADYRNRIWTVGQELPFAGHPSLGTAVAHAQASGETGEVHYVQQTGAGLQPIEVAFNGTKATASMLQEPAIFGAEVGAEEALRPLGLRAAAGDPDLPPQVVSTGLAHLMVPVRTLEDLARIVPNYGAIEELVAPRGAFGVYATYYDRAAGTARARFFARDAGIAEDPATGSAAGPLCAYLNRHIGAHAVEITQGVEMGRPSRLRTEVVEDRVRVSGDVVVVIEGTVRL
jgi:trans-2,3-dihydro-3-hydroxyanthranilate isomerase